MIHRIKNQRLTSVLLILMAILFMVSPGCDNIDYSISRKETGDVYFAGAQRIDTAMVATYWKNGTAVTQTDGTTSGFLIDMVVSNNDIYTLGYDGDVLTYWKNNVAVPLPNTLKFGSALCVSNNDVYVLAIPYYAALVTLVKNGQPSPVNFHNTPPNTSNYCLAMAISGNDIYLAGFEGGTGNTPVLWKNGDPIIVSSKNGYLTDVVVSGNDVYASATFTNDYGVPQAAAYWKNGVLDMLTDGTRSAKATSIVVDGNDVYVAGWELNGAGSTMPKYWKNGTPTVLSVGVENVEATNIAVSGSDVYVCGAVTGTGAAVIWKNGNVVAPFDGTNPNLSVFSIWAK